MRDSPLCSLFPCLYQLSSSENHSVASILSLAKSLPSPSMDFCRSLTNRKMTSVLALLSLLCDFHLRTEREKIALWTPRSSKDIYCRSFYSPSPLSDSIFSSVCNVKIPKVKFFVCQVLYGRGVNTWIKSRV